MGGYGSGADQKRLYAHGALNLSARSLATMEPGARYLVGWKKGDSSLSLSYLSSYEGGGQVELSGYIGKSPWNQRIAFVRLSCGAGLRAWWVCPVCARPCGKVYLRAERFACQKCQRLHYRSQSEAPEGRAWRAVVKAAHAIDPDAEPRNFIDRPPGMRRSKWIRLCDRHRGALLEWQDHSNALLLADAIRLGIWPPKERSS